MLEVEVIGTLPSALREDDVRQAALLAASTVGVADGHLAVEFVDAERIAALNAEHRGKDGPTDVLSFGIDEADEAWAGTGTRELGDVVICPEHTEDLLEAVVHGVLHLTGMDHETDEGEMLVLQAEILGWVR